jgi:mycoredoxin
MSPIKLYGATWCGDTRRSRRFLDDLNIPYEYHDIDHDRAAKQWAIDQNGGKQKIPVIDLGNNAVLIEPTDDELEEALRATGRL